MTYAITENFLTPNKWSRPQTPINKVKGVVIHWVANPNSTAAGNRNFFENRKLGKTNFGSAHFIVGLQGEIIQCLPIDEIAYHVGSETYTKEALSRLSSYPNNCTVGIECCHVDWNGKMTDATWKNAVELAGRLLQQFGLTSNDLWLHKEVVGWKECHKWFCDHPDEWVRFKLDVEAFMNPKKPTSTTKPAEVEKMEQWKIDMANAAIDGLAAKGVISDPKGWKAKVADGSVMKDLPWLVFYLANSAAEMPRK